MSQVIDAIAQSISAVADLRELMDLVDRFLEVSDDTDLTIRFGKNAIQINHDGIRFLLGDRWINLADLDRAAKSLGAIDSGESEGSPPTASGTYDPTQVAITGGSINGTYVGSITPSQGRFTYLISQQELRVGTEFNPTNATINAAQSTAGRAIFNLTAPASQTAASFLLRNASGIAIVAFRGGNSTGGNGPEVTQPVGGAIAIGNGITNPVNVVGTRVTGLNPATGGLGVTNSALSTALTYNAGTSTTAQDKQAIATIIDILRWHGLAGS